MHSHFLYACRHRVNTAHRVSQTTLNHQTVTTKAQLDELCSLLAGSSHVAIDTEFVSEDTYVPQLCLVQIATADLLAVVDPLKVSDLSRLWTLLTEGNRELVIHGGREELEFCLTAVSRLPVKLFDTQVAAGLISTTYPCSYNNLIEKYLNHQPHKGETRTDWRRRPLSSRQIKYALDDVRYLLDLHNCLHTRLESLGRVNWLIAEMVSRKKEVIAARTRERWHKVSGVSGLSSRSLAIVREIWFWREKEARSRNLRPKRVLRDDLVVELAKNKTAQVKQICAIRGLNRPSWQEKAVDLAKCVQRGLELPETECPRPAGRKAPGHVNLLVQFLMPALGSVCRQAELAPSLVGTNNDLKELVAYRLALSDRERAEPPRLAVGWRAQVVGDSIDNLLAGKTAIRIHDATAENPLVFEPRPNIGDEV